MSKTNRMPLTQILPPPSHLAFVAFFDDGAAVVHPVAFFALRGGHPVGMAWVPGDGFVVCEDLNNFLGYAATSEIAKSLTKPETT